MITIFYQGHARTLDIERGIASGHFDVALAESGRKQAAEEYKPVYDGIEFDAAFTSDTQRAYETAQIMLAGKDTPIMQDARLRECDYGDMTGSSRSEVEATRPQYITKPFPNGESYEQVMRRIKSFIDDLAKDNEGKTVLVVGHYATYLGLEHVIKGVPVADAMASQPPPLAEYRLG